MRSEGAIAIAAALREGLPILKVRQKCVNINIMCNISQCVFNVHKTSMRVCYVNLFVHLCDYVAQELNLSFGELSEAAALVVARCVKDKCYLEKLDLNGMTLS